MTSIRIKFSKEDKIRFVSHRDVARLFERALRKLRVPVAYSEGFSPRPKLSFGLALSVGHESDAEYLDVRLDEPVDLEALTPQLTAALPAGINVTAAELLPPGAPSLQQAVACCDWEIEVIGLPEAEVASIASNIVAASEVSIERERKGKTTVADVRPAILRLEIMGPTTNGVQLAATLATDLVSLRPTELVGLLSGDLVEGRVRRTHQWMIVDGARCEPIPGQSTGQLLERA